MDLWPRAKDQDRNHLILRYGGQQEAAAATNFIGVSGGAEYLCQ